MYVYQFMDATYRIDRRTNSRIQFSTILANTEAFKLYEGIYETREAAYTAMKRIESLLGI